MQRKEEYLVNWSGKIPNWEGQSMRKKCKNFTGKNKEGWAAEVR